MTVGKGSRAFGDGENWEQGPGNGQETAGGKTTRACHKRRERSLSRILLG